MSRRTAREAVMRLLYEYSINNTLSHDSMYEMADIFKLNKLSEDNILYIDSIIDSFLSHREEIDRYIESNSKSWSLNRIANVDLSILRLAVFELLYTDTPANIVCDEAVEIAKTFSSEKSSSFINGVLGGVIKEIKNE